MQLNFTEVLRQLGADAAFRIINAARPPSDYVLAGILPEQPRATYDVKNGAMTIRTTMAGLVGADSPYPPSGAVEATTFNEQTAKIANQVTLPEMVQRELQYLLATLGDNPQSTEAARNTVLNFVDKLLTQAHLDTMEYLRGQALSTFGLDWTFNKKRLQVDYGDPGGHLFAQRTGNNGYGGSTSKFWDDHKAARTKLKQSVRLIVAHPNTVDMIVMNPVNNIIITSQDLATGTYGIVRNVQGTAGGVVQPSADQRERVQIIGYGLEGEVLDPANPGRTIAFPFVPEGVLIYVGDPVPSGFRVGMGSVAENINNQVAIGYTHIGPTVEGGGRLGRWADVYVPEREPWQVVGRAVTNGMPVIEDPTKLVVLNTVMV